MKKTIFVIGLALSGASSTKEFHFSPDVEKNCSEEVLRLACGSPTEKNAEMFLKCVDGKIDGLSMECQELHQYVKSLRKGQSVKTGQKQSES